jgi:hypothetical protein
MIGSRNLHAGLTDLFGMRFLRRGVYAFGDYSGGRGFGALETLSAPL